MAYTYSQQPPESIAQLLPVGTFLAIPTVYETKVLNRTIDGRSVKIQLWKGFCPSYMPEIVGGAGAEVGIYKKSTIDGLWYPDYNHKKTIWFRLRNKKTGEKFFTASDKKCWWRHKWMIPSSYAAYKFTHWDAPLVSSDFRMHFIIEGTSNTVDEYW